ncbi:MAG: DUF3488 and transglutaminase-like domain-containing protein [Campylobacterota bacterium]|nr:DUF3488 and transglutaminase-like domain-containing protein [Campylobacterota bacterium]
MRSLNTSRFTDASPLRLLDLAYLTVLLPLLLVMKVPMLLFLLLVVSLLFFRKEPSAGTLILTALAGFLALFLSLYGTFNFTGLSRLRLFVELLTYLLIIAVSLQRLTRKINFYLLVSPVLLLALSLFFFHSIVMLGYVIVEIFVLLWLILAQRMQGSLQESLRMGAMLFAFSLPWVVLLFIFFPRISFEHASYGFRGGEIKRMGHDGTMYLDNNALLVPSDRIVMEVGFGGKVPSPDKLYFRGSMLYMDKKDHWEPLPKQIKREKKPQYEAIDDIIVYKVTLYPTQKRWLYLLDLPIEAPEGASIDLDFVTTLKANIDDPVHYEATSVLTYRYGNSIEPVVLEAALHANTVANPKSFVLAQQIKELYPDPVKRVDAIVGVFKDHNLTYSLRPKPLDLNHSVDSFLFDTRRGYCVHFASSFVIFSRMAGIPARIVTGYKGDLINSVENYLVIKERDAHAWAELLIDSQWVRFETTSYASFLDQETQDILQSEGADSGQRSAMDQINLYLMYAKYQVETWILEYSHFRQMQLLEHARNNPGFVLKFFGALAVVIILSLSVFAYFRRPICHDSVLCILHPLFKRLQKEGYVRQDGETLHHFFNRYLSEYPQVQQVQDIDRLYENIRYAGDASKESETMFRQAVKEFLAQR